MWFKADTNRCVHGQIISFCRRKSSQSVVSDRNQVMHRNNQWICKTIMLVVTGLSSANRVASKNTYLEFGYDKRKNHCIWLWLSVMRQIVVLLTRSRGWVSKKQLIFNIVSRHVSSNVVRITVALGNPIFFSLRTFFTRNRYLTALYAKLQSTVRLIDLVQFGT